MDVPSTGGPHANVMGQLRSQVVKHGRKKFSSYKKRFWVVNYRTKRLEVYKNDQSHEPANQWRAEDIYGVVYAGDKQNKFYAMIVQTRLKQTINFRMSSLEEREKWSRAITQLIDAFSISHRRNNVFEFLQRRTRTVGRNLGVSISVDWPRLLTAPHEMLEYTVEALESALSNVTSLVRDYGAELPVPKSYALSIQMLEGSAPEAGTLPGPQYDPVKRSAVLNVVLYKDGLNRVRFVVTEPEEVIHIMQSDVFRNPLIEGWIGTCPGCAEACEEIRSLLHMSASQLPITFQWGRHLSDSSRVEAYLQEFVNEKFFRGVLLEVRQTLREVEKTLEELLVSPTSTHSSPLTSPRSGGASFVGYPGGGVGAAGPLQPHRVHSRSFSATLFLPSFDPVYLPGTASQPTTARGPPRDRGGESTVGVGGGGGHHLSGGMPLSAALQSDVRSSAVKLLAESVSGLAIQLDKRVVDKGLSPPAVVVEHTLEYESRSRPAFLLVAKYEQLHKQRRQDKEREAASLHDQLFEVAFHALLSKQVRSLRSRLNSVFAGKVKVAIMWDRLLQVVHKLNIVLPLRDLPKLVNALADVCLPRMLHAVQLMSGIRAKVSVTSAGASFSRKAAGPGQGTGNLSTLSLSSTQGKGGAIGNGAASQPIIEESEVTVFDVFMQCVGGVVIDFFSFPELMEKAGGTPHRSSMAVAAAVAAALPELTLVDGTLTDALLCAGEGMMSAMVNTVNQLRDAHCRRAPALARGLYAYAATPRMGSWCEKYFSSPERVAACAAAPQKVMEDEFASDSDAGTADPALDLVDGEAVANERRAEISVLNMKRVVNTIYDSQGNSIDLKISAQDIRAAIGFLQKAFKPKRVTKHDITRVLTVNLRCLRNLYSQAAEAEANTALTEATVTQLLRDFCEFEETEALIPAALQRCRHESARMWVASADGFLRSSDHSGATTEAEVPYLLNRRPTLPPFPEEELPPHRQTALAPAVAHADGRANLDPDHSPSAKNGRTIREPLSVEVSATSSPSGDVVSQTPPERPRAAAAQGEGPCLPPHPAASQPLTTLRLRRGESPFADPASNAEDGGGYLYDFQAFSSVALKDLMPFEAVLARRAWRTGFVFGLENAGKSYVVNSIRGFLRPTVATVGLSRQVVAFDEWVFSLNELGGRESFRKNWEFYAKRMEEVHFLLHVVDCSSPSSYDASLKYLKEVLAHFKTEPMAIVFNNYQATPVPKDVEALAWEYEVDKVQKKYPRRPVFVCTHELSLAHAAPKSPTPTPATLRGTMRKLADVLFDATPEKKRPTPPKDVRRGARDHHHAEGGGPSQQRRQPPQHVRATTYERENWRDGSSFLFDYDSLPQVLRHSGTAGEARRGPGQPESSHHPF